ncbi:hypothetical protein ACGF7U_28615 [Micromonospora sp. NPDC047670]|uniref:hypothetical protein n=1 Tax=Micromonospora sp. NPDC047670 TaxID=3364252 RepID=UPI0037207B63
MTDEANGAANEAAFMSALVTEHFVLQSAASTTVSEAAGRASLFTVTLSSSLVALGFVAQSGTLLVPFVATTIPVIVMLGVFTVVRLVDTGVQNVQLLAKIANIRAYYRTLSPQAPAFFAPWGATGADGATEALATLGVRRSWRTGLFTMASMVAAVNSFVAGVGVALAWVWITDRAQTLVALPLGLLAAIAGMSGFLLYQDRRYKALEAGLS